MIIRIQVVHNDANIAAAVPNRVAETPADPTGTASTSAFVMAGLAIAFTPKTSGKVKVSCVGTLSNDTVGDGAVVKLAYGSGSAPGNGDTAQGTVFGNVSPSVISTAAGNPHSFALLGELDGLTAETAYWFDLQQEAITGGSASASNISVIIEEW